jgi:hypothetical protein
MMISWRIFVVISIILIISGAIAIVYLLDPSAFSLNFGVQSIQGSTSNQDASVFSQPSNSISPVVIKSTVTAAYCNCTDTQTDDG